jgi:hypothetical protein
MSVCKRCLSRTKHGVLCDPCVLAIAMPAARQMASEPLPQVYRSTTVDGYVQINPNHPSISPEGALEQLCAHGLRPPVEYDETHDRVVVQGFVPVSLDADQALAIGLAAGWWELVAVAVRSQYDAS